MVVCGKSGLNDYISLLGPSQALAGKVGVQALRNSFVHVA